MGTIVKLNTVQEYNMAMGVETLHPLVSVVDFSTLKSLKHGRKNFGFYCVFLKQLKCGELSYGRSTYDYQEGTKKLKYEKQVIRFTGTTFFALYGNVLRGI